MRTALTLMLLVGAVSLSAQPTSGPPAGIIPHLAVGGPWQTAITVVNSTSSPATVYFYFWGDDGSPLNLPIAGLGVTPGVQFNLDANGSGTIQTNASGGNTLSGWASMYSDSSGINAVEVFLSQATGRPNFEASVPLVPFSQTHFVLPFDETSGYFTGIALANGAGTDPSAGPVGTAQVFITIRDESGNVLLLTGLVLQPMNHVAFLLADQYPVVAGKRGTLEFQLNNGTTGVNGTLEALGLRFNPTGPFTSVQPMLIGVTECAVPSQ